MTDPLGVAASVVGITTAAIGSVKFLYTTISDINDVPIALGNIRSDLQAVEPILQKLLIELKSENSQVLLIDEIKGAIKNCNSACSMFKERLDHWMRHAIKHKAFWAEWADPVRVGIFEQGTINVFKGRLNDCKSTLMVALNTSFVFSLLVALGRLTVTCRGFMIKEVKESMLKGNELYLDEEKARANRESAAIESSLKQLSVSIRDEVNEESKRGLEQLLKEIQEQKASNEVFRKACEKALVKTKNIYHGIEQEIKNTKAESNSKAVAGLINISGEIQNIKQKISDTSAQGGSFAGAGIIQDLDLSIPSSRNK
ncbi:hypothetical protein MMC17_006905 [Xylographa soralifera]|nr:hypothetical protein [Xylographa soralifera]